MNEKKFTPETGMPPQQAPQENSETKGENQYEEITWEGAILTEAARKLKYKNAPENPPEDYEGYNWIFACAHCGSETITYENGIYGCSRQNPCGWGPGWLSKEEKKSLVGEKEFTPGISQASQEIERMKKEPVREKRELNVTAIMEKIIKEEQKRRGFLQKIVEFFKGTPDYKLIQQRKKEFIERIRAEVDKIKESMPDELKEKLKVIEFSCHESAIDVDRTLDYKVVGLEKAIETASAAGAAFNYDTGWAETHLSYEDKDTKVWVSGASNGWSTARPSVRIVHKNQEYYWEEPLEEF